MQQEVKVNEMHDNYNVNYDDNYVDNYNDDYDDGYDDDSNEVDYDDVKEEDRKISQDKSIKLIINRYLY